MNNIYILLTNVGIIQEMRDRGQKHSTVYILAHIYFQVVQAWPIQMTQN
jgi:hypothetical protein